MTMIIGKTMIGGNNMVIIIEGPDGTGKSTLAERVSKQTGWPVEHRSKPSSDEEKARMMSEYETIATSNNNVILDRCWYSEMTYGKVMRDQACICEGQMLKLESDLAQNGGAIIIYCPGTDDTFKACQERGEDYITSHEKYKEICAEYENIMNMPHHIPVVRYAYH